jgi:DNA-binding GntR family transcriptional regulator
MSRRLMDAQHHRPAATPDPQPAIRRRRLHAPTIPEQITQRVAAAIVNGEYPDGYRLREQELAEEYGVSRGPVREAIRALELSGLAILRPRRGAYVVGVSLDVIAEAFNTRAALAGIAAHQSARRRDAARLIVAEMDERLAEVEALADAPPDQAQAFAIAISRAARPIFRHCGAGHLTRALTDQVLRSIWGLMWRARPLDFHTRERRLESIALWRSIQAAIRRGNGRQAERLVRADLFTTRDHVLALLSNLRGESVDPTLLFRD